MSVKERHFVLGQCYLTFRIYQQENKNALPETTSVRPSVCVIQHLQMCRSSLRAFFTDRCRTARCHSTAHYLPVHVVTFGTAQLPAASCAGTRHPPVRYRCPQTLQSEPHCVHAPYRTVHISDQSVYSSVHNAVSSWKIDTGKAVRLL